MSTLIDDSYDELHRDECLNCGHPFRPTTPTHHYCSEVCAWAKLQARMARRDRIVLAPEVD